MEDDTDEVILRLTNQSAMMNKSNANINFMSTHKVAVDLDSDSDCCTSVSQRPINPLSEIPNATPNVLSLPPVKMLTYERFWQEQVENVVDINNQEVTEDTSSVGTFSAQTTSKHPIILTKWYPVISDYDLQIAGVTNGCLVSRTIGRRISRYIFYDTSETICSLAGPMNLLDAQPKFIQQKFLYGIPEDWTHIRSVWIRYKQLQSPNNFIWSAGTNLDSETTDGDLTINLSTKADIINRTELVNIGEHPVFSTPQNNTNDFYNITEISKINEVDFTGNFRQKLLQNNANFSSNRSVKKTYSTALLKKKLHKYQTMLKVSLMRECTALKSIDHIRELSRLQDETQNFDISDRATSQHEIMSRLQNISQKVANPTIDLSGSYNSVHSLQGTLSNETIKNHQYNNITSVPSTSQMQMHDFSNLQNTLKNDFGLGNTKTSSLTSRNKTSKTVSSTSSNMSVLHFSSQSSCDKINSLKTVNAVSKPQSAVKASDNEGNNVQRVLSTATNSEDSQNYVASKIFKKHRNSLTLLKNKLSSNKEFKAVENKSDESLNSNCLLDDADTYPNNLNSVVISFHKSNKLNLTSEINKPCTSKPSSIFSNNISHFARPRVNSFCNLMESDSDESICRRHKVQDENSEIDSLFLCNRKETDNTNKQRLNTMCSESVVTCIYQATKSNVAEDTLQNCQSLESNLDQKNENDRVSSSEDNIFAPSLKSSIDNNRKSKQVISKNAEKTKSAEHDEFDENVNVHQDKKIVTEEVAGSSTSNSIISSSDNIGKGKALKKIQYESSSSNSDDMDYSSHTTKQITDVVVHTGVKMINSESSNNQLEEENQKIIRDKNIGSLTKVQSKICDNCEDNGRGRSQCKPPLKAGMEISKINKEAEMERSDNSRHTDNTKIPTPQKEIDSSVKGRPKKIETKETNREKSYDKNINSCNGINQGTKQFPKTDKNNHLKKSVPENNRVQTNNSVFSNETLDSDLSEVDTILSQKGRIRCTPLPFWIGSRLKTIGDETIITNDSVLNSSNKNIENEKRLLTPQKVTSVAKKCHMKIPLKSPIRTLDNAISKLTSSKDAGDENIISVKSKSPIKNINSINHNEEEINVTDKNNSHRSRSKTKHKSKDSHMRTPKNSPTNSNKIPDDFLNVNSAELINCNVKDISQEYPENGIICSRKDNIKSRSSGDMNKSKSKNEQSSNKSKDNMPEHVENLEMETVKPPVFSKFKSRIEQDQLINNCNNKQGKLIRNLASGDVSDFAEDIFDSVHTPKLNISSGFNIKQHKLVTNNKNKTSEQVTLEHFSESDNYTSANVYITRKLNKSEIKQLKIATGTNISQTPTANVAKQLKFAIVKDNAENLFDSSEVENNNSNVDTLERLHCIEETIDKLTQSYDKRPLKTESRSEENAKQKSRERKLQDKSDTFLSLNSPKFRETDKVTNLCTFEENKANTSKDDLNITFVKTINKIKTVSAQSSKFPSPKRNDNDSNIEILDYVKPTFKKSQKIYKSNKLLKASLDYSENVDSGVEINTNCGDEMLEIMPSKLHPKENKKFQRENGNFEMEIDYTNLTTKNSSINLNNRVTKTRSSKRIAHENINVDTTNKSNCEINTSKNESKVDFDKQEEKKGRKNRTKGKQETATEQSNSSRRLCNISMRSNSVISSFSDTGSNLSSLSLNSTVSSRGRTRIPVLPFWMGSRVLSIEDGVEIIETTPASNDGINKSNSKSQASFKLQNKSPIREPPKSNKTRKSEHEFLAIKSPITQSKKAMNRNIYPEIIISNAIENSFQNTGEFFNNSTRSSRQKRTYTDSDKNECEKSRKTNRKNKKNYNENIDTSDSVNSSVDKSKKTNILKSKRTEDNEKANEERGTSEIEDKKSSKDDALTKNKTFQFVVPKGTAKKALNKKSNNNNMNTHKMELRKKHERNELEDSSVISKTEGQGISKRKPNRIKTDAEDIEQSGISDSSIKTKTVEKLYDNYTNKHCSIVLNPLSNDTVKNFTDKRANKAMVEKIRGQKGSKRKLKEIITDNKESEQSVISDRSVKTNTIHKPVENVCENYINKDCVVTLELLSDDIIKSLTNRRSDTIKEKTQRISEVNSANTSKVQPLPKKTKKRKNSIQKYMNDPQSMSMIIKVKKKRRTKEELPSITPNIPTISTENATKKSGKRKLYSEGTWLNSEEFLQSVSENDKSMSQNFCIQVEQNNIQDDFDDAISEVSALVKK